MIWLQIYVKSLFRQHPTSQWKPFLFSASICFNRPTLPVGRVVAMLFGHFFSIAKACNGISGRDQTSGAGDKSSVWFHRHFKLQLP